MPGLADIIHAEIAGEGSIPFERFMELALYHPQFGYYRHGRERPRTGRRGDFFTSVSVGPLFGRLLARQFLEMWELLGRPSPFWIIEQGAEDGRLAVDILAWCQREAPSFFEVQRYGLIEESPDLEAVQKATLASVGLAGKAAWFRTFAEIAAQKPMGVIFSNELVDALPVHRVVRRDDEWREFHVAADREGNFIWQPQAIRNSELAAATKILPAVEGYTTEINLRSRAWMKAAGLTVARGYIVTCDYGFTAKEYYAEFRRGGTLTVYRGHRRSDEVLADPGGCDLTAHVDFTALGKAGEQAGMATLGLLDQQHFFTGIAHDELADRPGPRVGIAENTRAWQTLTHPNYLGARFRVLLQAKDAPGGLAGLRYARVGALD